MTNTIANVKNDLQAWQAVYLFDIVDKAGVYYHWSTRAGITWRGNVYDALVANHSPFKIDIGIYGIEAVPQFSMSIHNEDATLTTVFDPDNWRGAQIVPYVIFVNPLTDEQTTDFRCFGIFKADLVSNLWPTTQFNAFNILNTPRKVLPLSVITRTDRYPFPDNAIERAAAHTDPTSEFFPNGYSPDDGQGNYKNGLSGIANAPHHPPLEGDYYHASDYDGMESTLATYGLSVRFGGFSMETPSATTFTPNVKGGQVTPFYGSSNPGKFGKPIPLIYGTCRITPVVLDTGSPCDGVRSSHLLLCDGVNFTPDGGGMGIGLYTDGYQGQIIKVILPDSKKYYDLPEKGTVLLGQWNVWTGYFGDQLHPGLSKYSNFSHVSGGANFPLDPTTNRQYDFPQRDSYSGVAILSICYPQQLAQPDTDLGPRTDVVLRGLRIETWSTSDGVIWNTEWKWTDNPVWVYIDLIKRLGIPTALIDKAAAYESAMFCAEQVISSTAAARYATGSGSPTGAFSAHQYPRKIVNSDGTTDIIIQFTYTQPAGLDPVPVIQKAADGFLVFFNSTGADSAQTDACVQDEFTVFGNSSGYTIRLKGADPSKYYSLAVAAYARDFQYSDDGTETYESLIISSLSYITSWQTFQTGGLDSFTGDWSLAPGAFAGALAGDLLGSTRFRCNLPLADQQEKADALLTGVLDCFRGYTTPGSDGKLQIKVKRTFAEEGGAAFVLDETNILRDGQGKYRVRKFHKSIYTETPNSFAVTFQDEFNNWNEDTYILPVPDAINDSGSSPSTTNLAIRGIPNMDQARRLLNWKAYETVYLNEFYDVYASHDLIEVSAGKVGTISETRNGLVAQQCRIVTWETGYDETSGGYVHLILQKHSDAGYTDLSALTPLQKALSDSSFSPHSVGGASTDSLGSLVLSEYFLQDAKVDNYRRSVGVSFAVPPTVPEPFNLRTKISRIRVLTTGGDIAGNQTLWLEVCPRKINSYTGLATDGMPSIMTPITIPSGTATNSFSFQVDFDTDATALSVRVGTKAGRGFLYSRPAVTTSPTTITVTSLGALNSSDLTPDPRFDHVRFYYYYNQHPNDIKDGGRTLTATQTTYQFEPSAPLAGDTSITVIACAANANETDFYPLSSAPTATLALTGDTGNPAYVSVPALTVLQNSDDAKIPIGSVAFEFTGPDSNYDSVTDIEVVISTALPAEGPSAAERAAHAGCKIEPAVGVGSCVVRAGDRNITVTRVANPAAVGRVLLIFTNDATPDSDLEGHIISAQALNSLTVDIPFSKGGTYSYVVVTRWWDLGTTDETTNSGYYPFKMAQIGSPGQTTWRTPHVNISAGTFYASLRARNKYGVGPTLVSAQFVITAYTLPTDSAAPGAVEDMLVGTSDGAFSMRWANPATNINTLRNFAIKYSTSANFTTGVVGPFLGGLINVYSWFDPTKTYYFAVAANNASGDATVNTDAALALLITDGWGPWTYWDGDAGSVTIGDAVSVESGTVTGLPSDPDVPNAPALAVITEKLANGTFAILFGVERPTVNFITAYKTQVQIARDSGFTDIISDQTGAVPFTNRYYTTQVATFYVRARTANDMGWSAWCATELADTMGTPQVADTDVPGVVQNVEVLADDVRPNIPGKELVISWDRPLTNFTSIFAYAIQINDSNVFAEHLVWFFSTSGEAIFGDTELYDPNGKFTTAMEGKTLWIHSAFPMLESNLKATAVVRSVTDDTHLIVDKGLTLGGTGLKYQIITPDWENVVKSITVPTKLLDKTVQSDEHFNLVVTDLPHSQDLLNPKQYWVRIKAANEFGLGAWCLTAPPAGANLDGIKQGDLTGDGSNRMDAAAEYFTVIAGTFTDNSPIAGSVSWSGVSVYYRGQSYFVADGNTANKYVVWKLSAPTVFSTYATPQTLLADEHYVVVNNAGTSHSVFNGTDVDGGTIRYKTIDADRINVTVLSAIASYLGSVEIATSGYLRCGQTAYNTGTGFWLGLDGATAKFSIGAAAGNRVTWDGTTLNVIATGGFTLKSAASGARVELTTSGMIGYNSDGIAVVSLDASTGYLGFATAASGSRLIMAADGLRTYSGAVCTVWLANTGAFTIQTAASGARVVLDSSGLTGYDATGATIVFSTAGNIRAGQTAYNTGTGFWLGQDAGTAKFSIGAPAGNRVTWSGTTLTIVGTIATGSTLDPGLVTSSSLNIADRGWLQTCAFTTASQTQVSWGAGSFVAADGTTYSISAGNTGTMAGKTYVYLATGTSTTAYQVSSTATDAIGAGKVLVAVCNLGSVSGEAQFLLLDQGGMNVDATNIVAGSITANNLAVNALDAYIITLSTTGCIKSGQTAYNTGVGYWLGIESVTPKFSIGNSAGNRLTWDGTSLNLVSTGSFTFKSAATGARFEIDPTNGIRGYDSSSNLLTQLTAAGAFTLKSGASGARVELTASGMIGYNADGVAVVSLDATTGYLGFATAASGSRLIVASDGLRTYSGAVCTVWLANTGAFTIQTAASGARVVLDANGLTGYDATGATIVFSTAGNIKAGQTAYNTGTGFWLGQDAGTPKFSIGTAAGNRLTWDGSALTLVNTGGFTLKSAASGARVELTSSGMIGYNSDNAAVVSLDASTGYLGFATAASGSRLIVASDGLRIYSGAVNTVWLANTGAFTIQTAASGARVVLDANGLTGYDATGATIIFSTAGNIKAGQTAYNTGTGFWLGQDSGTAKFSIGVAAGNRLTWDGSSLVLVNTGGFTLKTAASGARVELLSSGLIGYNADGVAVVSLDASTGYLGFATAASGSRLIVASDGLRTYSGATNTVYLSSDGSFTIQTATSGARIVIDSNGVTSYDSTGATITLSAAGNIKAGQTAYNTGTGFWLGQDSGTPKFSIGAAAGNRLTWDGSTLTLVNTAGFTLKTAASGARLELTSSGLIGYNSDNAAVVSLDGATGYLGFATAASGSRLIVASDGLRTYNGAVCTVWLSNAGAFTIQSAASGARVVLDSSGLTGYSAGGGTINFSADGNIKSGQSAYDTGTGFWLGMVSTTPKFSIGDASGNKLTWDGSTLTVKGTLATGSTIANGIVTSANLNLADRGWLQTCTFASVNQNKVGWGAGSFVAADGTTYSITPGGDTGTMAGKTFVYLNIGVSTLAYQVSTTATDAIGTGKVLIAICNPGSVAGEAQFLLLDQGGVNLDATNIVAGSIVGNNIAATTITTTHLNFTAVQNTNVVAYINASAEGIKIAGSKIQIDGTVTFTSGYDPTTKVVAGGAAADINANSTTISGGKITSYSINTAQLSATAINGMTITGATVQTSASGARVQLDTSGITLYDSGNTPHVQIGTGYSGLRVSVLTNTTVGDSITISPSNIVNITRPTTISGVLSLNGGLTAGAGTTVNLMTNASRLLLRTYTGSLPGPGDISTGELFFWDTGSFRGLGFYDGSHFWKMEGVV